MKTGFLVGIIGLGLCTGLLLLNSNSVTVKSKKINACDPQNNTNVQVKGIVSKVSETETGSLFVTVTDGTNGCEVFVAGSKRQLNNLRILGNRVSFNGTIHNGIVSQVTNIQENVYGVVDAQGNLGETIKKKIRINHVDWDPNKIVIKYRSVDGSEAVIAPRDMADKIKWGEFNNLVIDANGNVLSINGEE